MTAKIIKLDGLCNGTEPILEGALTYLEGRGIARSEVRRLEIVAEVGEPITLTPTLYVQAEGPAQTMCAKCGHGAPWHWDETAHQARAQCSGGAGRCECDRSRQLVDSLEGRDLVIHEFPNGTSQADIDAFRATWKANGGSPADLKNGAGS